MLTTLTVVTVMTVLTVTSFAKRTVWTLLLLNTETKKLLVFVFGPVSHMVKTEGLRIGVLGIVVLNNLHVLGEFSKSELVLLFGS